MANLITFENGERYLQPSSFELLPTQINFSVAWFLPLTLIVILILSALVRQVKQNKEYPKIYQESNTVQFHDKSRSSLQGGSFDQDISTQTLAEKGQRHKKLSGFGENTGKQKPKHIAVIMDGNRRFGNQKHGVATKGHWDGGNTLVEFVKWCLAEQIGTVTVYAFSSENWKRPQHEINVLMQIFVRYCDRIEKESLKNGIRVRFLSTSPHNFAPHILERFRKVEETSKHGTKMNLNVCVSYGSREEIALACRNVTERVCSGEIRPEDICSTTIKDALLTSDAPDPDLIMRTSGEKRLSNFLLFQAAYAEFIFVDKLWPAIKQHDFRAVLDEFARRKRRFGK